MLELKSRQLVPLSVVSDLDYVVTSAHRPSSSLMVLIETEGGVSVPRQAAVMGRSVTFSWLAAPRTHVSWWLVHQAVLVAVAVAVAVAAVYKKGLSHVTFRKMLAHSWQGYLRHHKRRGLIFLGVSGITSHPEAFQNSWSSRQREASVWLLRERGHELRLLQHVLPRPD